VQKRRRLGLAMTEQQQVILVVVLVVLLAASVLYCAGLGSLALRQWWENYTVPQTSPEPLEEELTPAPAITSTLPLPEMTTPAMTPTLPVTLTTTPAMTSTLPLTATTAPQ